MGTGCGLRSRQEAMACPTRLSSVLERPRCGDHIQCELARRAERDVLVPRTHMVWEQHSVHWWEEVLRHC